MKHLLLAVMVLIVSTVAHAHLGEHEGPVLATPPHGGVMKKVGEVIVEVVAQERRANIYIYDLALAPRDLASVKVTALLIKPKSKAKKETSMQSGITVQNKGQFLVCDFAEQSSGLHRFTLRLAVDDPKTGHAAHVDFTIEP